MIDICVQIAEDEKARPYSRIQAANTVLDKALKFDENDFMRKELAKSKGVARGSRSWKIYESY